MSRVTITIMNVPIGYEDIPGLMRYIKKLNYGITPSGIVIVDQDYKRVLDPNTIGSISLDTMLHGVATDQDQDVGWETRNQMFMCDLGPPVVTRVGEIPPKPKANCDLDDQPEL